MRHLIASLIHQDTIESSREEKADQKFLEQFDDKVIDWSIKRRRFIEFVRENFEKDDLENWESAFEIEREKLSSLSLGKILTHVNSDSVDAPDKLGIKNEYEALAAVVAAKDVSPPFAIGLFGDWGSGKTFFMEKMRARVKEIARVSAEAGKSPENAFCGWVVQIWFNAWHFVEANLWASLVDHIFTELRNELKPEDPDAKRFNHLIEELGISEEQMGLIGKQLEAAERRFDTAAAQRDKLRVAQATERQRSKTLRKSNITQNGTALGWKLLEELRENAGKVEEVFGLNNFKEFVANAENTTDSLMEVYDRTGLAASRAQNLAKALIASPIGLLGWTLIVFCVAVLMFFVFKQDSWQQFQTFGAELFAALGLLAAWAKNRLAKASKLLDAIDGVRQRALRHMTELERAQQKELEIVEREVEQINAEVLAIEEEYHDARRRVEEIKAELEAGPQEGLDQVIYDRADGDD